MRKMVGKEESIEEGNKRMLMNQAIEVKHHAVELMEAISKNDKVDAWVVAKLERATTDLSDITHYLEGASQGYEKGGMMNTYDEGGEMEESDEVDLFEDYENIPDNVQEILEKYEEDFEKGNYKRLQEAQKELEKIGYTFEFGLDGVAYNLRKMRYGGYMADGGVVGQGFRISEMRDHLRNMFPDSFGFTVNSFSKDGNNNVNISALVVNQDEPYRGLNDEDIKSKLYFPQYKRDHDIRFRIYQGGENTYFYFVLDSENGDQYIGQFGFKDDGDVPSQYITKFIAFLMEQYGLPFDVKHSVMEKGGMMAKGGETTIVDSFGSMSFRNQYDEYEMVVVSKELEKDGGSFHKDRFFVSAKDIDEAKKIAIELWQKEFGDSDLSIVKVMSNELYKLKYMNMYADGGKVKFSDKVKSISMRLEGTKVPKRLEDDYGKRYSKLEAKMAAQRIAGSMKKKGY